jgi:hypothetical protein
MRPTRTGGDGALSFLVGLKAGFVSKIVDYTRMKKSFMIGIAVEVRETSKRGASKEGRRRK